MLFLAKFTSVLIAVFGFLILCFPPMVKKGLSFWAEGKRIYLAGLLRLLLGFLFLGAASESAFPRAVIVFGFLFLLAGILIFVIPREKLKAVIAWWLDAPSLVCRFLGLFLAAFALLMFLVL